jgi:hypothetical protein
MSRGLGTVQRKIMDLFTASPDWMPDSIKVAEAVFARINVTDSQTVSVRRALRRLVEAKSIVQVEGSFRWGRSRWCLQATADAYYERVRRTLGV